MDGWMDRDEIDSIKEKKKRVFEIVVKIDDLSSIKKPFITSHK